MPFLGNPEPGADASGAAAGHPASQGQDTGGPQGRSQVGDIVPQGQDTGGPPGVVR